MFVISAIEQRASRAFLAEKQDLSTSLSCVVQTEGK